MIRVIAPVKFGVLFENRVVLRLQRLPNIQRASRHVIPRQNASLLTNDRQARQAADEIGIPVSGAIGVLEYGVEAGKLLGPDAVRILEEMVREGAWISEDLLEMFRRKMIEAGEE